MVQRTWLITGVSSGFGREMAQQLLERGERVVGTVRDRAKVSDLLSRWPVTFDAPQVDVTDSAALRHTVDSAGQRRPCSCAIAYGSGFAGAAKYALGAASTYC